MVPVLQHGHTKKGMYSRRKHSSPLVALYQKKSFFMMPLVLSHLKETVKMGPILGCWVKRGAEWGFFQLFFKALLRGTYHRTPFESKDGCDNSVVGVCFVVVSTITC